MSKRIKKVKHIYVDKYKDKSIAHQAEVARDFERWDKERLPVKEPTSKSRQSSPKDHPRST